MKNQIVTKVMSNPVIGKAAGEIGRFYINHQSTIITCGTIGFSMATTAVAMRNADRIKVVIADAKDALSNCDTKEERKQVYVIFLKELTPLVLPIVIFQAATIGCAIFSKKQLDVKDQRIAELAGALSIAQTAVAQYQTFQKEAEEALGEDKYAKLQNDIYKKQDVDCRRYTVAPEGDPGQTLYVDKYSGRPFWSYSAQMEYAAKEMGRRLSPNGGYDYLSINDYYDIVDNPDLAPNELGRFFGYAAGEEPSVHFSDTHVIFPNGTRVQAAMVYLYPEPGMLPETEVYF